MSAKTNRSHDKAIDVAIGTTSFPSGSATTLFCVTGKARLVRGFHFGVALEKLVVSAVADAGVLPPFDPPNINTSCDHVRSALIVTMMIPAPLSWAFSAVSTYCQLVLRRRSDQGICQRRLDIEQVGPAAVEERIVRPPRFQTNQPIRRDNYAGTQQKVEALTQMRARRRRVARALEWSATTCRWP